MEDTCIQHWSVPQTGGFSPCGFHLIFYFLTKIYLDNLYTAEKILSCSFRWCSPFLLNLFLWKYFFQKTRVNRTLWEYPLFKKSDSHIFYRKTYFIAILDSSHQAGSSCSLKFLLTPKILFLQNCVLGTQSWPRNHFGTSFA